MESNSSLLKGQDPLCDSPSREAIRNMDFSDCIQHKTKTRTKSNDSSKSDFSDHSDILKGFYFSIFLRSNLEAPITVVLVPIHRRSSGSLSPRLIQFKRRESIDNIINEEKNHEHEVNDVNNLNCKVEDLLGMIFYFSSPYKISDSNLLFSDRNKKIPNTVTPSNSPNRRSIGKQVCNYSFRAFFCGKNN